MRGAVILALLSLGAFVGTAAEPIGKVFGLKGREVIVIDPSNGSRLGAIPLKAQPDSLRLSPDGSRVLVLDKLPVHFGGYPNGRSVLTLIDTSADKVLTRLELGWTCEDYDLLSTGFTGGTFQTQWRVRFSPDAKHFVVFCNGKESKKPEEAFPPELLSVDVAAGEVTGRIPTQKVHDHLLFSPAGETLYAMTGSALDILDARTLRTRGSLTLEWVPDDVAVSADGKFLYLVQSGLRGRTGKTAPAPHILVVSTETPAVVARLDAGQPPRRLVQPANGNQVLLFSSSADKKSEVRFLRGPEVAGLVPLAAAPSLVRITPDRTRFVIPTTQGLTLVDAASLKLEGQVPAPGTAQDVLVARDGKRCFLTYQGTSTVRIVDLERRAVVATMGSGNPMKVALLEGLLSAANAQAARTNRVLNRWEPAATLAAPGTAMALSPGGDRLYVLNTQSGDVTIFDSASGTRIKRFAVAGSGLEPVNDGRALISYDAFGVSIIDTETNSVRNIRPFKEAVFVSSKR